MALHINIEDLLNGKAVESNRLDYKEGWNPDTIYRTICAFANDFEDAGGGYVVIGVKEENGRAVRSVKGINPNQIESIEKEMVGFNNLIQPYYQPRLFIEEADGKTIIIIKVTAGDRRPYKVPDQITAKLLRSRRYRNRRLGEFLKELDLTEGRSTGTMTTTKKIPDRFVQLHSVTWIQHLDMHGLN